MKIIIFDFEVFKFHSLFGAKVLDENDIYYYQTWNLDEIRSFYQDNIQSIWIGHNIEAYDNLILQAIVKGCNEQQVKIVNDNIIHDTKRYYLDLPIIYYDLIKSHFCALKTLEAYFGKNIHESEIDFNLNRTLSEKEMRQVEAYNRDDLDQTYDNFMYQQAEFLLRLDVIKEFGLPMSCLAVTGTRLAEEVLHATKIPEIESWVKLPTMWPTLQVKNKAVIDFYMNRDYASSDKSKNRLVQTFCGTEHILAAGGIHGAKKKYHAKEALYFDVSGYYNLIMILLDLLPRSIPPEYRKFYEGMYHKQLELKKTDPGKRGVYKTILLSVFGAMNNKYCRFYDPYHGDLVRLSGQMFLVDLLEKLEGLVSVVQSNTDGIIAELLPGIEKQKVINVINEWQTRTGFVLKLDTIYDIYQRDVNCYLYKDDKGEVHTLGEAVKDYGKWEYPFWKESYNSKEPLIICHCIVEYFMNGKLPEQTIEENKRTLRMFQYICKKQSFDYVEYEETDLETNETQLIRMQNVNRAFALNSDEISGMLFKCRAEGKTKRAKISNLPDSVFVENGEILSDETIDRLETMIDYDYYVKRAYERILEFIPQKTIKEINV